MRFLRDYLTPEPASETAYELLLELHAVRTPSLLLVTGASGTGKTTWCDALRVFAAKHGWTVAGLLSPAVVVDGRKVGIDLLDLRSGEQRRLAVQEGTIEEEGERERGGSEFDQDAGGRPVTGRWSFDPETIRWGNEVLASIFAAPGSECPDLLIIDELGPLEFRQKAGLQAGMKLIDAWRCNLICATMRPSLMGAARMRWPWSRVLVVGREDEGPRTNEPETMDDEPSVDHRQSSSDEV